MTGERDQLELSALMTLYFDGLYHCDSSLLRTVFHNRLSYVNANAGEQEFLDLEAYMQRIDARTSPASRKELREAEIGEIMLKGPEMGVVAARSVMLGRDYQDLLTVIRTDEGWRIASKIFTFVELED